MVSKDTGILGGGMLILIGLKSDTPVHAPHDESKSETGRRRKYYVITEALGFVHF